VKFIVGVIIGLLIPAVTAYFYLRMGYAPVATSSAPMPFEKTAAQMALNARIAKEAPKRAAPPLPVNEPNLSQGAAVYVENCAFCHGLPNQKATLAAKGMFPPPPQLFSKDEMVADDPVGVTYWKVANGIRLSGMPGFGEMLTKDQVWQVSMLLAKADKLPPGVHVALEKATVASAPSSQAAIAEPAKKNAAVPLKKKK
jgi:mono/diheme cytochrome c family protein